MVYLCRILSMIDFFNHVACIILIQIALNASTLLLSVYQQSLFSVSRSLLSLALVFSFLTFPGNSPGRWFVSICLKLPAFLIASYFIFLNFQTLQPLSRGPTDSFSHTSTALACVLFACLLHILQLGASLFAWVQKETSLL